MKTDPAPHTPSAYRGELLLLLCAMLWGSGFVAQRAGMASIQPFTFIAVRYLLGALVLLPVLILRRSSAPLEGFPPRPKQRKAWLTGSLVGGGILFAASGFQQTGLVSTAAGKAGFITAFYIILVPVIGLLFGRKVNESVWAALAIALPGLYLLISTGRLTFAPSDLIILAGALLWALHILAIDRFSSSVDGLNFAFGQFLVAGILGLGCTLLFENAAWPALRAAAGPLLYSGVVVTGGAFTLQVLGQKSVQPATAALILSLESVFALLAGMALLGEALSAREWLGSALAFGAVLLTVWRGQAAARGG